MKTELIIQTRSFDVRIRDQRTGEELTDSIVLEANQLRAAVGMGLDFEAVIHSKYNRMGYWVLEISKGQKRTVTLNLEELNKLHDMAQRGKRELVEA